MKYFLRKLFFISAILTLFLAVSLYKLDEIPGEWFGDISNVHEYVREILEGKWPFYFLQSPGPLYHYAIIPIVLLFSNRGYTTYKIASIVISLLGVFTTYLFVKEISSRRLAYITVLIMSVSMWYLVWSRLGNSQIIIPAISASMSYFLVRFMKNQRTRDAIFGGITASLGWYTYPQTFIFPVIYLLVVFLYFIKYGSKKLSKASFIYSLITIVLLTTPFIYIVKNQPDNFTSGYIGGKVMPVLKTDYKKLIRNFTDNYLGNLGMFHFKGDATFRLNVEGKPQLDKLSGILLIVGIINLLIKKPRTLLFIFFIVLMMMIPASSPAINNSEIPNNGRVIAVISYVYYLIAAGYYGSYLFILRLIRSKQGVIIIFSLLMFLIAQSNLKSYFIDYVYGLPDHNQAWGKEIAWYIDENVPAATAVYFGSCCWGAWGHPEPKSVYYILRKKRVIDDYNKTLANCHEVKRFPAMIIIAPQRSETQKEYKDCFPEGKLSEIYGKDGELLFKQLIVKKDE